MKKKRTSFVFYGDWYDAICGLDDSTALEVCKSIMAYALGRDEPKLSDMAKAIMMLIRPQIDRDTEKWLNTREKRSIAGKKHKGNQYSKVEQMEQNGTNGTNVPTMEQNGTNGTVNVNDNVDVDVNDNVVTIDDNKQLSSLHSDNIISTKVDASSSPVWAENFVKFFNNAIDRNNSVIAKIRIIQGNREKQLKARIKQYGEEAVCEAITKATQSAFLNGQKGFIATIDWILKPNNFPKILEGNYDNRETSVFRTNECEQINKRIAYGQQTTRLMREEENVLNLANADNPPF